MAVCLAHCVTGTQHKARHPALVEWINEQDPLPRRPGEWKDLWLGLGDLGDFAQVAFLCASTFASANPDGSISRVYSGDRVTDVKCVLKS